MATKKLIAPELKPGEQHYAFARVGDYPPPRPRKRPEFQPWRIDARKFLVDPIRPFPEWPLICRVANLPAFPTEKEMAEWQTKNPGGVVLRKWTCRHCNCIHYWAAPGYLFDTNGGVCAGAKDVPERIEALYNE